MPKFQVLRRVDAFVDYTAEVEADTAEEAASTASDNEGAYEWEEVGLQQFDARLYVTLDDDGNEIPETLRGDY